MLFHPVSCPGLVRFILAIVIAALLVVSRPGLTSAQSYEREFSVGSKPSLTIKNRNGRVSVVTSDDQKDKAVLQATSPGAPVEPSDISISGGDISVRERRAADRIDLIVRVPARARGKVESESGMVDVVGDLAVADVSTNTGTIHADVPLDDVKFKFLWQASHPRFLSDVELPRVKEGHAGSFSISGTLGPNAKKNKNKKKNEVKKPESAAGGNGESTETASAPSDGVANQDKDSKSGDDKSQSDKDKLVQLNLTTQRGVILLNVDPSMAPNDLRERALTEAAKGIVRSGNVPLIDAIRT